jgi:hypothetical protein
MESGRHADDAARRGGAHRNLQVRLIFGDVPRAVDLAVAVVVDAVAAVVRDPRVDARVAVPVKRAPAGGESQGASMGSLASPKESLSRSGYQVQFASLSPVSV